MFLSALNTLLCLILVAHAVWAINHMDYRTAFFDRLVWVVIGGGNFMNLFQPPGLTPGYLLILAGLVVYFTKPLIRIWIHRHVYSRHLTR